MQLFNFLTGAKPPLITQSLRGLAEMLDTAVGMFAAATAVLLDNEALELDLSALDASINARERQIRRAVAEHVTSDPRDQMALSLVLVSIVQDAERCGDLAKSLAKTADLAGHPRMGPHVEALRPIRDRVQDDVPARPRRIPIVRHRGGAGGDGGERPHEGADGRRTSSASPPPTTSRPTSPSCSPSASRMIGRTGSHLSNIISSVALPFDQIRRSPTWTDE